METKFSSNGCVYPQMTAVRLLPTNSTSDSYSRIAADCSVVLGELIPDSFDFWQLLLFVVSGLLVVLMAVQTARKFRSLPNRKLWFKDESFMNFIKILLYALGIFVLSGNPGRSTLNYSKQVIALFDWWNLSLIMMTGWSLSLRWLKTLADLASKPFYFYERITWIVAIQCIVVLFAGTVPFAVNNVHLGIQNLLGVLEGMMICFMNIFYGGHVVWSFYKQMKKEEGPSVQQGIKTQEKKKLLVRLSALIIGTSIFAFVFMVVLIRTTLYYLEESRTDVIAADYVYSIEDLKGLLLEKVIGLNITGVGFIALYLIVFRRVTS